jgi:hypothetical protein
MKRKYYLADTLNALDESVAILHNELHIEDNNIHIISNNSHGLKEHHLHPANIIHKSNIIRGAERGALYGVSVGIMFFAVAALEAPFWDVLLPVRQMILLTIFSSPIILGFLAGAFVGVLNSNFRITQFDHEIDMGHHLMLVDSENIIEISKALESCSIVDVGETSTVIFPFDEQEDSFQHVA